MLRRPRGVHCGALAVALALLAIGPGARPLQAQATSAGQSDGPLLAIELAPEHEHYRSRVETAARTAMGSYLHSLGARYPRAIRLVDASLGGAASGDSRIPIDLPWRSAPVAMEVESRVAFAVARAWWPAWNRNAAARPIVDGLAWYLQSRVVPDLFDLQFHRPGYSGEALRFFGDAVPWGIPLLTHGASTAGLGLAEFRRDGGGRQWPDLGRRLPVNADPLAPRIALAFGTLERLVGWPALEAALAALGEDAAEHEMTPAQVEQLISSAIGYPLAWFLVPAWDHNQRFDYELGAVSTAPCDQPSCLRTTVIVHNRGSAAFSGTVHAGTGDFPAGDALELRVTFQDGRSVSSRWGGREASKTFVFESAAPPTVVALDPDRVLLLDQSYLDDHWQAEPGAVAGVAKWVAWWLIWVQDASLGYVALF